MTDAPRTAEEIACNDCGKSPHEDWCDNAPPLMRVIPRDMQICDFPEHFELEKALRAQDEESARLREAASLDQEALEGYRSRTYRDGELFEAHAAGRRAGIEEALAIVQLHCPCDPCECERVLKIRALLAAQGGEK